MYRGIPIGDAELGEDEEQNVEVVAHGVELNNDEKEFLRLPKSASDFAKIDMEKIETSIQVTAAKLRMSLKDHEENDSQEPNDDEVEHVMDSRRVYNPDERSVDWSKTRVTDMATCRRITVPDAAEASKEAKLQVLINNLEDVAVKAGREEAACH